jgi:endonuclease YncB( thermonuclease family)
MRYGIVLWIVAALAALFTSPALALPVCEGGDRAARKLTCIVDGDTGWESGVKWRLLDIDTPEISQPECDAEYAKGIAARDRLREIMASEYRIQPSRRRVRSDRELVRIEVGGRDVGEMLIAEGLAQPWPNSGNRWCNRR